MAENREIVKTYTIKINGADVALSTVKQFNDVLKNTKNQAAQIQFSDPSQFAQLNNDIKALEKQEKLIRTALKQPYVFNVEGVENFAEFAKEVDRGNKEIKRLQNAVSVYSSELQKTEVGTDRFNELQRILDIDREAISRLTGEIKLGVIANDSLAKTFGDQKEELKLLERELGKFVVGSDGFEIVRERIEKLKGSLETVKPKLNFGNSFQQITNQFQFFQQSIGGKQPEIKVKAFLEGVKSFDDFRAKIGLAKQAVNTLEVGIKEMNSELLNVEAGTAEYEALSVEIANAQSQVNALKTEINSSILVSENFTSSFGDVKKEFKFLTDEIGNFIQDSADFNKVQQRVQELKDRIKNYKEELNFAGAEDKIGRLANGFRLVDQTFQNAGRALQSFGIQSEETQLAMERLNGAIAILEVVAGVFQLIREGEILMKAFGISAGVATVATEANTAATELNSAANVKNTASTGLLATAKNGLSAAVTGATGALRTLWVTMLANPITALLAAAGGLLTFFLLFSKSSKQLRAEMIDFNKTINETADAFRELEASQQGQFQARIIELNRQKIESINQLNKARRDQLKLDFDLTNEEIEILESGNAQRIESLKNTESLARKLRKDGAKEVFNDFVKTLNDETKLLLENGNKTRELVSRQTTEARKLIIANLSASPEVGAQIQTTYLKTFNSLNDLFNSFNQETREKLSGSGIVNVQSFKDVDLLKKKLAELSAEALKTGNKSLFNEINSSILQASQLVASANIEIRNAIIANNVKILGLENDLFQARLNGQAEFDLRRKAIVNKFDTERAQILEQRGKTLATKEADIQLAILKANQSNELFNLENERTQKVLELRKQETDFTIDNLEFQLIQERRFNTERLETTIETIERINELRSGAIDLEIENLKRLFAAGALSELDFQRQAGALQKEKEKENRESAQRIFEERIRFFEKELELIERENAAFNELNAQRLEGDRLLFQSELNIVSNRQDVLNKQLTITDSINKAREKSLQLGELDLDLTRQKIGLADKEFRQQQNILQAEQEALEFQIASLSNIPDLQVEQQKQLENATNSLAQNLQKQKNLRIKNANEVNAIQNAFSLSEIEREIQLSESIKRINEQRFKTFTDTINGANEIIQNSFKLIISGIENQIQGIQNQLANVNENIASLDAKISDRESRLSGLEERLSQADSSRRDALVAQIQSERDNIAQLSLARSKEVENKKRLEAQEKQLAEQKKQREREAAKVDIAVKTAQTYAALGLAIAQAVASPTAAAAAGLTLGVSSVATITTILTAGLAAIAQTIAAAQTFQFEKGGILKGASHENGGILLKSKSGDVFGEAEGGEAILTKGVTKDPELLQVASKINVLGGGKPLTPHFQDGGIISNFEEINRSLSNSNPLDLSEKSINKITETPIFLSITDLNKFQERVQIIENSAKL